jgi:ribonuclease R
VRQELRGERTGIRHGAGSKLRVQVSRVDLDARKIDFRLVVEGGDDKLLSRGRRNAVLPSSASAVEELSAVRLRDREVRAAARGKTAARSSRASVKSGTRPKTASAKKTRR